MKKLLVFVCALIFAFAFVPSAKTTAKAETTSWIETEYLSTIKSGETLRFYDRTAGTDGEKQFAIYLEQRMISLGYTPSGSDSTNPSFEYFTFTSSIDGLVKYSQNLIFKKAGTVGGKKVVICTSYDNAYGFAAESDRLKMIGEDASLSNVMCALSIAQRLSTSSLEYDIEFVFFGAEYHGYAGGREYSLGISPKEAKNILLAINIDDLSAEGLFYYDAEKTTKYGSIFGKYSKNNGLKIEKYSAKNSIILSENELYPFTHRALMSDNTYLMQSGVRVISLLSVDKNGVMGNEYYKAASSSAFVGDSNPKSLAVADSVSSVVADYIQSKNVQINAVGNGKLSAFLTNKNIALAFVLVALALMWATYFVVYKLLIKKLKQKYTPKEAEAQINSMVDE